MYYFGLEKSHKANLFLKISRAARKQVWGEASRRSMKTLKVLFNSFLISKGKKIYSSNPQISKQPDYFKKLQLQKSVLW